MSCEDRESGSYTLPANEFNRLKREIKAEWDRYAEILFKKATLAQSAYPKPPANNPWGDDPIQEAFASDEEFLDAESRFLRKTKSGNWAKPLKSDLQKSKFSAAAKNSPDGVIRLSCYTGSISLNVQERRVGWHVSENNHSVESARSHPVAGWLLNRFLPSVKWTPKTGGMIAYTNEFMRDDEYSEPQERDMYGKCDPQQRMNPRPQVQASRHRVPPHFRF